MEKEVKLEMVTGDSFRDILRQRHSLQHSPSMEAILKNCRSYGSLDWKGQTKAIRFKKRP